MMPNFHFFPQIIENHYPSSQGGRGGGNSEKYFNTESANRASATGKPSRSKDGGGGRNAEFY